MKILVLSEIFPTKVHQYSGVFIFELLRALKAQNDILVVNPKPWFPAKLSKKFIKYQTLPFREEIEQIQIIHPRQLILPRANRQFFMGFTFLISTLFLLRKELRQHDFDLILGTTSGPVGFASVLLGKVCKKPVVVNAIGSDIYVYPQYFFLRKMVVFSLRSANVIIAACDDLKKKIIKFGIDKRKIETIVYGVDLNKFRPQNKDALRNKFAVPNNRKVVVYIGNLVEVKGVAYLIEAVKKLIDNMDSLELFIVGDGYLSSALKSLVEKLGIISHVRFIGPQDHDSIPDYLGMSDVLVLPSLSEAMPTILKEALACGIPVVATKVGGVPELITSDDLGILVPPANIDLLCDAMERALRQSWNREQLVNYAKQFSWERIAELYMRVFNRLTLQ